MKIKLPYGSTAQNNQLLLPQGMLTVDMDKKALRIHDGSTQGGFEIVGQQAYFPPFGTVWAPVDNSSIMNNNGTWNDFIIANNGDIFVTRQQVGGVFMGKASLSALPTVTPVSALNWSDASSGGQKYVFGNTLVIQIQSISSGQSGRIYISLDNGTTWQFASYGGGFTDVIQFNGRLVFAIGGNTFASSELATPTALTTRYTDPTYRLGTYFVIVGTRLYAISNQASNYTDDGINWTAMGPHTNGNTGNNPSLAFYRSGYFYAIMDGKLWRSSDAHTWTVVQTLTGWAPSTARIDAAQGILTLASVSSTWRLVKFNETTNQLELPTVVGFVSGGTPFRFYNGRVYTLNGNSLNRTS